MELRAQRSFKSRESSLSSPVFSRRGEIFGKKMTLAGWVSQAEASATHRSSGVKAGEGLGDFEAFKRCDFLNPQERLRDSEESLRLRVLVYLNLNFISISA